MKVGTVGLLAALGMTLTSVSVWSLTPEASQDPQGPVVGSDLVVADPGPAQPVIRADFTAGSTVMVEGRLGNGVMQAGRDNETYLMARVFADGSARASEAAPVNLAIVIDRSGSMKGKRMENAINAAKGTIAALNRGDVVSVIAYDAEAETLVQATTIDEISRQRVTEALSNIRAIGDTCISCAMDAAERALANRDGMVNRVMLLTDGEPTRGMKDVSGFERMSSRLRDKGISVSTIGVDVDYNERILSAIARESNGRHYFVENADSLTKIFEEERNALKQTVAKDTELVVDLAPGIRVEKVFDRAFRQEGNKLIVPMGTVSGGEEKTLLVRLSVPRGAEGERAVAKIDLAYQDLVERRRGSCNGELAALISSDPAKLTPMDPFVAARVGRSETAQSLLDANALFAQGRVEEAQKRLTAQLEELNRRRAEAQKTPNFEPKADKDFDKQEAALGAANSGFAQPPPPPGAAPAKPAPETRKGKAQTRSNAEAAADLAF
ncbi:MAG: VWA domain-containing protein [Polyangiaceae bacterium]